MSRYVTVRTQFKDEASLIQALMETGQWSFDQIEIHSSPQHLYGYHGDLRPETANIIVRRKHVGAASNDIGFIKTENGYGAIISQYDQGRYGEQWVGKLKGNYAYHQIKNQAERKGRTVTRTRCPTTGRQRIEISGYR